MACKETNLKELPDEDTQPKGMHSFFIEWILWLAGIQISLSTRSSCYCDDVVLA